MKIFISAPSNLKSIRAQIAKDLGELRYQITVQKEQKNGEGFPNAYITPVTLKELIRNVDGVIQILGTNQGSIVGTSASEWMEFIDNHKQIEFSKSRLFETDKTLKAREPLSRITYTQWEAWFAILMGKKFSVFVTSETNATTQASIHSDATKPFSLNEHIQNIRPYANPTFIDINNPHELLIGILKVLTMWNDNGRIPLASIRESYLWAPHAISMIIESIISKSGIKPKDLANRLSVDVKAINQLTDGTRLRLNISTELLHSVCQEHHVFLDDQSFFLFLQHENSVIGWTNQLSLINQRSECGRELRSIIENKISLAATQWLNHTLDGDYADWKDKLSKLISENHYYALPFIKELYHISACRLTPQNMLAAARADFSAMHWQQRISTEPSQAETHLRFANSLIGERVAKMLLDSLPEKKNDPVNINILEGGVGGAHTTFYLLQQLEKSFQNADRKMFCRFLGFEVVADMARSIELKLSGQAGDTGERGEFFSRLKKQGVLSEFPNRECFIENCTMEAGISDLARDEWRITHSSIDIFVSSYAFHHVPNGYPIREFLTGIKHPLSDTDKLGLGGKVEQSRNRHVLCKLPQKRKEAFQRNVIDGIRAFLRGDSKPQVLKQLPKFSEEKVYLSLILNESPASLFEKALNDFRKLPEMKWQLDLGSHAVLLVKNPQKNMLLDIYQLLRPGGFIVIADPDGTSVWNARNIQDDPEIMLANFLGKDELIYFLTRQLQFEVMNSGDCFTVGKDGNVFFSHGEGPNLSIGGPDSDPNRGYVIIARKPNASILYT
jgi:hypothetical protein